MSEEKSRYDVKLRMFGIPRLLPFLSRHKKMFIWMLATSMLASVIDSVYRFQSTEWYSDIYTCLYCNDCCAVYSQLCILFPLWKD